MEQTLRATYITNLRKQVDFLRRSCEAFDQGYLDEAIRVAVVLRVLFHSTQKQTSVLRRLGAEGIRLLTTSDKYDPGPEPGRQKVQLLFLGLAPLSVDSSEVRYKPWLGESDRREHLPFSDWYDEIVYSTLSAGPISRRGIIVGVADKEGAHIDHRIDDTFKSLAITPDLRVSVGVNGRVFEGEMRNYHYCALRQMGYEVLSSEDLSSLAGVSTLRKHDAHGTDQR